LSNIYGQGQALDSGRIGRLWQALAGFGRLWQALAGFGRLWQALAGFGRLLPHSQILEQAKKNRN
jgi:hypothetical protein